MDENRVVELVCSHLKKLGCEISQRCTTKEHGIDIIARNSRTGEEYFVEAKGATSSMEGTKRHGKPFSSQQVLTRAAKGVLTCLALRVQHSDRVKYKVILAVPDGPKFRKCLKPALPLIGQVGIEVWYVFELDACQDGCANHIATV